MADYLRSSRSAYYGVVAALPLLLTYELLLMSGGTSGGWQVRNAGDVWLRMLLASLEVRPTYATLAMILVLVLCLPLVYRRETPLRVSYLALMLLEGFAYSLALGLAVNIILEAIFSAIPSAILSRALVSLVPTIALPLAVPAGAGAAQGLALSLGAGLFEEFLFRVVLLGALLAVARQVLPHALASVVAIVLAALLFSAAHYVGPLGDPFTFVSFLFRFVAGLLFTLLYYGRGFAVTAYAHAFYDIRVILL